jgi:hypothetical protein
MYTEIQSQIVVQNPFKVKNAIIEELFWIFFGGLECTFLATSSVGCLLLLNAISIRTQRLAVASRSTINVATHPSPYPITIHLAT